MSNDDGGDENDSFQPYIRSGMERERVRARDRITAEGKYLAEVEDTVDKLMICRKLEESNYVDDDDSDVDVDDGWRLMLMLMLTLMLTLTLMLKFRSRVQNQNSKITTIAMYLNINPLV
ncbi:hypothetical protein TWF132_008266 [Orbilia oligospora]|nr:hypothetical protein TWF132_008266 [Orbilia oligospora]